MYAHLSRNQHVGDRLSSLQIECVSVMASHAALTGCCTICVRGTLSRQTFEGVRTQRDGICPPARAFVGACTGVVISVQRHRTGSALMRRCAPARDHSSVRDKPFSLQDRPTIDQGEHRLRFTRRVAELTCSQGATGRGSVEHRHEFVLDSDPAHAPTLRR
jgi:hypothetical protein